MDLVPVPVYPDPHALLDVTGCHVVTEIDHELGKLLHIYYVLGILRRVTALDDFCHPRNLQRLLTLKNDAGKTEHR